MSLVEIGQHCWLLKDYISVLVFVCLTAIGHRIVLKWRAILVLLKRKFLIYFNAFQDSAAKYFEKTNISYSQIRTRTFCSRILENIRIYKNNEKVEYKILRDGRKISLLILSEFRQINQLLFPLKSSENHSFSVDFRGNSN